MNSDETNKNNESINSKSTNKIEMTPEGKLIISEQELLKLLERTRDKTASECHSFFKKFHKEELEFQRKTQLEDREYDRNKKEEDAKFKKEHMRNERFWRILAIILALLALYWLVWDGTRTREENSRRAINEHKVDLLRQDMVEKKKILQIGTDAISNLRVIDADIIRHCQYGHPYTQQEQDEMRWNARQKIADAFALVPTVFGEEALAEGRAIVQFDQNIKDMCTYKGDVDNTLLKHQRKLLDLIGQSIDKDKHAIEKIK